MAIIYECDRCQRQGQDTLADVKIPREPPYGEPVDNNDFYITELCMSCLKELVKFTQKQPKVMHG